MKEVNRIREVYRRRIDANVIDRYSLLHPGELYMQQVRERAILRMLAQAGIGSLRSVRVLEIGCGRGHRLADFQRWGAEPANLHGVDLVRDFIEEAHGRHPGFGLAVASAHQLPYAAASFDIVAQFTVFTSILDATLKKQIAAEALRVLKPGGAVLWYDFRYPNPWNADVRPIGPGEIRSLFPGQQLRMRTLTLLPPMARRLARISTLACELLESLPPLRSHVLGLVTRRADGEGKP